MRVEIVEVGEEDSAFYRKEGIIGQKGTFATTNIWSNHFYGGTFYFDNQHCSGTIFVFHEIKTKPIFDA